jgi:hypothetical protein
VCHALCGRVCGNTTWAGCGEHIDPQRGDVIAYADDNSTHPDHAAGRTADARAASIRTRPFALPEVRWATVATGLFVLGLAAQYRGAPAWVWWALYRPHRGHGRRGLGHQSHGPTVHQKVEHYDSVTVVAASASGCSLGIEQFESAAGRGVRAVVDGRQIGVGSPTQLLPSTIKRKPRVVHPFANISRRASSRRESLQGGRRSPAWQFVVPLRRRLRHSDTFTAQHRRLPGRRICPAAQQRMPEPTSSSASPGSTARVQFMQRS